jgi:DnaK suppressor protein
MMVSILQLMGFSKGKPVHSPAEEKPAKKAQETSSRRDDVKAKPGTDHKPKAAPSKPAAASKSAAKPVAKVVPKATAKPAVTTPVKAVPVKSAKPESKTASPALAKAVAKTPVKSASPVSVAAKPVVKAKAPVTPPAAVVKEKKSMSVTPTPAKATQVPAASVAAATSAPAKAGRPSSRLAQLTVPSMAQTVASTAAKASYSQASTSEAPPPVLPAAVKKDAKLVNSWKTKPVAELTDADLLAMPDSEYMNEVQMAAFRLKLVVLKTDILSNAGETTEHLREDSAVVPDPADRATIEEEHALELRTRDRERKLLKKIEQSIARIDAGDYGYCDETGEAIGVGRLLARPTATLSLEAQQRRELKQKMFGD